MDEPLSDKEKEMMLDFPGELMTREEYAIFIEEWEKDCEAEREIQRSFPY